MFQFFSSLGASTTFEKYRLEITAKTFEAPTEQSLRGLAIVNTFTGQDPETKSQIAFATIVKKLLTSDSRYNWLYLLKNLIILDRIVDEGCFAEEVSDLSVATLDSFKESESRNLVFDSERVIACFWRLIKQKSSVLAKGQHVFCHKRSQRTDFLSKLKHPELLIQIQSIEGFFTLTFEFVGYLSGKRVVGEGQERVERAREEWSRSSLLEFLYLQVLHKLMLYYSCQLLCNQAYLQMLTRDSSINEEDIRKFKRHVLKFRQNANEYIRFVEARKHIRGFEELNYKQLNPYKGEDITRLLDQLIQQKQHEADSDRPLFECLAPGQQLRVQKKPFADLNTDLLTPRLRHHDRTSKQEPSSTCFTNWNNSFSNSFPQSEVLSVDLLLEIRRQQAGKENIVQEESAVDDSNRDSVMYGGRDTNITADYTLVYRLQEKSKGKPLNFRNQFSELTSKWNA